MPTRIRQRQSPLILLLLGLLAELEPLKKLQVHLSNRIKNRYHNGRLGRYLSSKIRIPSEAYLTEAAKSFSKLSLVTATQPRIAHLDLVSL